MPPPDDVANNAQEWLDSLQLQSFSAEPAEIMAGRRATLSWQVTSDWAGGRAPGSIELNLEPVPMIGSARVRPVRSRHYRLTAAAAGRTRRLGEISMTVDTSAATQEIIDETFVRELLQGFPGQEIEHYNEDPVLGWRVKETRQPSIEIVPQGIVVDLRNEVYIPPFANPRLNINATIAVGVSAEGRTTAYYKKFAVDLDWPWYVTLGTVLGVGPVSFTVGEATTKISEDIVNSRLKWRMLDGFRDGIDAIVNLDRGFRVIALETAQDRLIVTRVPR